MYKLAFCTSIKNRFHHIRDLPYNLGVLNSFKDVEIQYCVLNYDSTDGLYGWIKHFNDITYDSVRNRPIFHHANAKNNAHRMAYAKYLLNVDADNFITYEYLSKLLELIDEGYDLISHKNEHYEIGKSFVQIESLAGSAGRICVRSDLFYQLGGYNEDMMGWGNEDSDLIYRFEASGFKTVSMPPEYLSYTPSVIHHTDEIRVEFQKEKNKNISNRKNMLIANSNYVFKKLVANEGIEWGR
jgi:predicted glycosyltransferase involved in capsule biosynthesis